ncbi:MAG TPA: hypothetical protein VHN11_06240 [Xanthobacteraceae bacterium]|jgi:hypothetical protein|nr:hypothetical protein [Xanthobacteraceae bacterium]
MSQPSLNSPESEDSLHSTDVVREILQEVGSLSRLMQLHYLAQEPGLLEIMYRLAALSDDGRAKLEAFLAKAQGDALNVREDSAGSLILEWQENQRPTLGAEPV